MLANGVREEMESHGGFSLRQYGFIRRRSCVDAITHVVNWAKGKPEETWRTRKIPLIILLDVKNVFNSVPWPVILEVVKI